MRDAELMPAAVVDAVANLQPALEKLRSGQWRLDLADALRRERDGKTACNGQG
jgi:hypothetical protein